MKKHDLFVEFLKILEPYDSWDNSGTPEKNLEAKQALMTFCQKYKKLSPDTNLDISNNMSYYMTFVKYMVAIKKALDEEKYMTACNEIISLMYYEPFLQGRFYYNLIKILEEKL